MECNNYIRIDGPIATLSVLQTMPLDPLLFFPNSGQSLTDDEYMIQEFGCKWLTKPQMVRRLIHLECTFDTDDGPPLRFYERLAAARPDIRITYEYFHFLRGIVGHGPRPVAYTFKTFGQLAAIRSTRLWRLDLAAPGELPPAPWEHEPARAEDCRVHTEDDDWTMVT